VPALEGLDEIPRAGVSRNDEGPDAGRILLSTGSQTRTVPVRSRTVVIDDLDDIAAIESLLKSGSEVEFELRVDPWAPASPIDTTRRSAGAPKQEPDLEGAALISHSSSVIALAGPGVVHAGAVTGLHDLAVAGGIGVLNTWGAKGVFDWRSRHHLATVGLQELDFELGGLADVDLIVGTGLDQRESPDWRWRLSPFVIVEPATLTSVAEILATSSDRTSDRTAKNDRIDVPPIRSRLAEVTQQGWVVDRPPLQPSRVTRNYAEVFGSSGLVAADPGIAGYWVARTFATTGAAGSVIVPSESNVDGFACACLLVDRLRRPLRPALAVVDAPVHPMVHSILDLAAGLGVNIAVEAWGSDGDQIEADAHLERLRALTPGSHHGVISLATDPRQLPRMLDVAGRIIAWN